jgi:diguanylate cyclase (GGDEF)-like protein
MIDRIYSYWKKYYLVSLITLFLIVGFATISIIGYVVPLNHMRDNTTNEKLPLTGDNIYSEIQRYLLKPTLIASVMANDTFLRDWILEGEKDLDQLVRYLSEIKTTYNTTTSFLISETTRNYYHPNGIQKQVVEGEPRDEWYFRVKAMEVANETSLDPDIANWDVITIFCNHKVFDYDGNLLGVTGVGLTLDNISTLINNMEERFHRHIFFVSEDGNITITSKEINWMGGSIFEIEGVSEIADKIINEERKSTQLEHTTSSGNTIMVNSRYLPELNWYLVVIEDAQYGSAPIRNIFMVNMLISSVIAFIVCFIIFYMVTRSQQKLERTATTDSLTGTLNRQGFEQIFSRRFEDLSKNKSQCCILLLDVDHFKQINDTYGHLAGDEVLRTVAEMIMQSTEPNGIVSRWGGDEYLVFLQNTSLSQAMNIAEYLRQQVNGHKFVFEKGEPVVSISIGCTSYTRNECLSSFFSRADHALYAAKMKGRNRVHQAS